MITWLARRHGINLAGSDSSSGDSSAVAVSPHVLSIVRYTFLNSAANAIWIYGAWGPLVYTQFPGKSSAVGWLAAMNGVFEIVGATAGGWLGDGGARRLLDTLGASQAVSFTSRLLVVRMALVLGLLAVWLHVVGLLWLNFAVLMTAQAACGLFTGMSLSGVEALVADLVPQGQRDRLYALKYALEAGGPVVGCFLSVALFLWFGDAWSLQTLLFANFLGLAVQAVSLLLLGCALPSAAELVQNQRSTVDLNATVPPSPQSAHGQGEDDPTGAEDDVSAGALAGETPPEADSGASDVDESLEEMSTRTTAALLVPERSDNAMSRTSVSRWYSFSVRPLVSLRQLPYFVVAHDTLLTVGSGFTTMYFSLFMMVDYHISPTTMALLLGSCGVCTSCLAALLGRWSPRVGRVGSIFVVKVCGTLLLLFIFVARNTWMAPVGVMAVVYAMRYGAMNSCSGVTRSLIMDVVPTHQRARWNAVESLQSASWSGTSVVGGYVVDRYGFGAGFLITLVFHATSCLLLVPCLATEDRPEVLLQRAHSNETCTAPRNDGVSDQKTIPSVEEECAGVV